MYAALPVLQCFRHAHRRGLRRRTAQQSHAYYSAVGYTGGAWHISLTECVQYVISVFAPVWRAGFCYVKETGIYELECIPAHTPADHRAKIQGPRVPMEADFGKIHKPHQHDKPQNRQHVPLGGSGRRPRCLPVETVSMFTLATRLGSSHVISWRGLVRVILGSM